MSLSVLADSRVLMIMAHCDDEVVCGWPILQDLAIQKTIVMVSSDRHSKDRQWCAHRRFVFLDVCKRLGIESKILNYDSNFYSLPSRDGSLLRLERSIGQALGDCGEYDYVFTHNPFGEYGHLDHRYLFHITAQLASKPVLISDICMQSDWTASNSLTKRIRAMYYRDIVGGASIDHGLYHWVKKQYELARVWTWNHPPVTTCDLYSI